MVVGDDIRAGALSQDLELPQGYAEGLVGASISCIWSDETSCQVG